MRSLIVLVLVWLAFQFGSLLISAPPDSSPSGARVSSDRVHEALRDWPEGSRDLAMRMIADYGMPDGMHEDMLWWTRASDTRIVIYRDHQGQELARPPASMPVAVSRATPSDPRGGTFR